jgi:hypothetical protein
MIQGTFEYKDGSKGSFSFKDLETFFEVIRKEKVKTIFANIEEKESNIIPRTKVQGF